MVYRSLAIGLLMSAAPVCASAQQTVAAPIEQTQLRELDAWSVSAISAQQGALPSDLWNRSEPAFVAALMDRLPATYESPAAYILARRVLLSGGDAPRGDASAAARERFEALGKMGAADELAQMAAGSGRGLTDPQIAQYAAQAELARGRRPEACARGRNATAGETPPPFLLRLRAYCAAVTGDRPAAQLALELARANNAEDAWYTGAVNAAAGAPSARPPAARYDNSLATQLSLAAQLRPGPNALNESSTLALVALARAENAPQPQRAQAAALAYRRGALSVQETRTILLATPAEIASALPPILVALRQVQAAPGSLAAASAIAGVLRQSAAPADFAAAARFFKDDIAALQSAPDAAAALLFARAALVSADTQLSQRLVASARQAGADEAALAPLDAALAVLVGVRNDNGTQAMHRRIDGAGARGGPAAARDVAILAALGAPVDAQVQTFLLANAPAGGTRANAGAMLALQNAADRGALGEGALLAVVASGDGVARLDADSVDGIIRSLRALRLENDARRFAIEAILAGAPS
ncbi:hypothetical protein [Terricaulis sp.]|uniref:hypothetical protein n=1 Tax=Terricaulis sp. TaxID=2768686 RepID=UPI00378436AB